MQFSKVLWFGKVLEVEELLWGAHRGQLALQTLKLAFDALHGEVLGKLGELLREERTRVSNHWDLYGLRRLYNIRLWHRRGSFCHCVHLACFVCIGFDEGENCLFVLCALIEGAQKG